jgi:hypothetical protein
LFEFAGATIRKSREADHAPSGVHRERDGLEEKNALERFAAKRH